MPGIVDLHVDRHGQDGELRADGPGALRNYMRRRLRQVWVKEMEEQHPQDLIHQKGGTSKG